VVNFQMATPSDILHEVLDRLSHHDMADGRYDGDRATRLVDASYALHMAVIALNDVDLDQGSLSCVRDDPASGGSAGPIGTTRGSSAGYDEHIGNEMDECFIHPIFKATLAMQSVLQRIDDPEITRCLEDALRELDDVIRHARRFVFGLDAPSG